MPQQFNRQPTAKAFTLVELMVVIGIIALLMSFLLPMISRARDSANTTACLGNMHQIGLAMIMYAGDNDGQVPYVKPLLHQSGTYGAYGIGGGPAPGLGDGKGGAITYDNPTAPNLIPAPQNRPLNKYMSPTIYDDVIAGQPYKGVYHYEIWKCPSDQGEGISQYYPKSDILPTLWEVMGTSYLFNDYNYSFEFAADKPDYVDCMWNRKKISRITQSSRVIAFYEPPAKPIMYGTSSGVLFRWHNTSSQSGSYDFKNPGTAGFVSNIIFFDGHADSVDFTAALKRTATGSVTGFSERATSAYAWYIAQ